VCITLITKLWRAVLMILVINKCIDIACEKGAYPSWLSALPIFRNIVRLYSNKHLQFVSGIYGWVETSKSLYCVCGKTFFCWTVPISCSFAWCSMSLLIHCLKYSYKYWATTSTFSGETLSHAPYVLLVRYICLWFLKHQSQTRIHKSIQSFGKGVTHSIQSLSSCFSIERMKRSTILQRKYFGIMSMLLSRLWLFFVWDPFPLPLTKYWLRYLWTESISLSNQTIHWLHCVHIELLLAAIIDH